jgi:hypothetical protein
MAEDHVGSSVLPGTAQAARQLPVPSGASDQAVAIRQPAAAIRDVQVFLHRETRKQSRTEALKTIKEERKSTHYLL